MGSVIEQKARTVDEHQRPLHWSRAHLDGAPFRGDPVRLPEELYAERVEKVTEAKVRLFDLSKPKDQIDYADILNRITAGVGQLVRREFLKSAVIRQVEIRDERDRVIGHEKSQSTGLQVHMEWVEFYMQDNQRNLGIGA